MKTSLIKKAFIIATVVVAAGYYYTSSKSNLHVNVYDWYGMLPRSVLKQFEEETGIKVWYDVYDDNDMLEAKLLASNCGYDVIFPSISPYAARHIKAGLYQPLNKEKIPNLENAISPFILKEMKSCDPHMTYCIPYYWGTLGILYDADVVEPLAKQYRFNPSLLESYDLIFNASWLKHVHHLGVSLLAESVDVFPAALRYMGISPHSQDKEHLEKAFQKLMKIRPFIKRFSGNRFVQDILLGDVCIAQAWSGEAMKAIQLGSKMDRRLVYVTPKEGSSLWIDGIAIPKGAPHPEAAHKFINFLLRPDISAQLMAATLIPTSVASSYSLISAQLKNTIFPKKDKNLSLDPAQLDTDFERERTRLWARVRLMQ